MKKVAFCLLALVILSGCSSPTKSNTSATSESSEKISEHSQESSTIESSDSNSIITDLNVAGEIKSGDKVMYTIEATEVKDITEKAKSETTNNENTLDFYSNGQAKQAVKVTLLMKNNSGEALGLPYLDGLRITDQNGISSVGGWKDQGGSKVEFGYYDSDEYGNAKPEIYEIVDGENKMATSTVLLATPSKKLKFVFTSEKYNDSIEFELPIDE